MTPTTGLGDTRPGTSGRSLVLLLAAVLTLLITMLSGPSDTANAVTGTASGTVTSAAGTTSGPVGPAAETRVGASSFAVASLVGVADGIAAGQRRGGGFLRLGFVSATSVAAEGAGSRGLSEAFHYTRAQNVASIESKGLLPGGYATPNGGLSPLQAQIDLALPPNRGLPGSLIRIDLDGLRAAGYEIPGVGQVGRSFNMPGGGFEMQFPYQIPPEFLKVIR